MTTAASTKSYAVKLDVGFLLNSIAFRVALIPSQTIRCATCLSQALMFGSAF